MSINSGYVGDLFHWLFSDAMAKRETGGSTERAAYNYMKHKTLPLSWSHSMYGHDNIYCKFL